MSHCLNPWLQMQEFCDHAACLFPQLQNDVWKAKILNLIFGEYPNLLGPAEEHKHRWKAGNHL